MVDKIIRGAPNSSLQQISREYGIKKCTVRKIVANHLGGKSLKTVAAQKATAKNEARRAEARRGFKKPMVSGDLGNRRIFFTYEEIFRIGREGGQNS